MAILFSLEKNGFNHNVRINVLLPTSAALLKLAEMEYSGANSIFIKTLLDKKYALPFRVIDALVFHFVKFEHDRRILPVLWHQALLVFVQVQYYHTYYRT